MSCVKEGDFSELRHNFVLEGDFDPVLGTPIAKMSANIATLIGMVDSSEDMQVYIDSNDLVSIRYCDSVHTRYSFLPTKNTRRHNDGLPDTIWGTSSITGEMTIDLFTKLHQLSTSPIESVGLFVNIAADMVAFADPEALQILKENGVRLYFNNLKLNVTCLDGFCPTIPIADESDHIDIDQLVAGSHIKILDHFDCSYLVTRRPSTVRYSIDFNIGVPAAVWENVDETVVAGLGLDSIVADIVLTADFPMQMYCRDLAYLDTIVLDMDVVDSVLNRIDNVMTINDSSSYLVVEARNSIPLSFALNASLLDQQKRPLTENLLEHDSILYAAPIRPLGGSVTNVSDGYTESRIVLPLNDEKIQTLRKTKYISYHVLFASSTTGVSTYHPVVSVQGKDRLDLRTYLVIAPHVRLSIPINIHRNK